MGVAVAVGLAVPLPAPVMLMLSDLPALLTIVSVADFLPSDDGVKTIDNWQLPSAARLPTQVPVGTNSEFDDAAELISTGVEFGL